MGHRKVNKLFTDVMQGNIIESSEDFESILLDKINKTIEEKKHKKGLRCPFDEHTNPFGAQNIFC